MPAFLFLLFMMQLLPLGLPMTYAAENTPATADFTFVAKKAIPAVVSITTKTKKISDAWHQPDDFFDEHLVEHFFGFFHQPRKKEEPTYIRQGSGFLLTANGYIITNAYLAWGTEEILVRLYDGREFSAMQVGQDPNTDIAMLKITGEDFPFLELEDSLKAEIGQWVAAVGNPKGTHPFLTAGVISALSQGDVELNNIEDFLHTDALINRGNSGGPLLTLSGRVLGLNTALVPHTPYDIGIGFIIPSHMIHFVADQLMETGKVVRGYLGVSLRDTQNTQGVLVTDVQSGSGAEKVGLKQGDLIMQYNQKPVDNAVTLRIMIARTPPGSEATLQIMRNQQPMQLHATVTPFPNIGPFTLFNDSLRANILGIEVERLTPTLAQKFGLIGYEGVIIRNISPNSMASWLNLKPGTLILTINHQPIQTIGDFYKATSSLKKGDNVLMRIREHSLTHYVTFRIQ